ncbi:Eco57I restriction-modification methylase domain-containing protein [Nocardioides marmoriginsengisoli]|nr:type IIL restriction-modification enzyme MmeI [Nocardioides marmoriginsengisoli]
MEPSAAIVELIAAWEDCGISSGAPGGDVDPGEIFRAAVAALLRAAFVDLAERRGTVPASYEGSLLFAPDRYGALPAPSAPACAEIDDLGRLYESLLGLTCRRDDRGRLEVVATAGRKHAGAHYTPPDLAAEVVRHALAPLVAGPRAILDLRVADIAAGSGAFLLAAARDLGGRDGAPSLRQIVSTCLYGADIDALAVEVGRLSLWLLVGDPDLPLSFLDEHLVVGNALLDDDRLGTPVDWAALAPAGFDAVVGNPPFLGVKGIRGALGRELRDHLAGSLLDGESGRSDLAIFFLARARRLSTATIGLVLPAAIWSGDNYRFGLARAFEEGFACYRAETSRPWPSDAGVRIALTWLSRIPAGRPLLDGVPVDRIPATRARDASRSAGPPPWMPHGFQASIVLGKSLLLTRDEAAAMIGEDSRAERWIREYLSGDDLVSTPGPSSSRCVLDLAGADLDDLLAIPPIARRLRAVRTERDGQLGKYPQLAGRWWTFLNRVDRLYDELAGFSEVIAFSKHAKYTWPVLVGTGPVFSNGAIVYPTDDRAVYGFLASTPHRIWATEEGGSRLNQSHRYNPSRLLRTYPFPDSIASVRGPGEELAAAMSAARDELGVGVTEVLNRVHGADRAATSIERIRRAITEVDAAVLAVHGLTGMTDPAGIRSALVDCASERAAFRSKILR